MAVEYVEIPSIIPYTHRLLLLAPLLRLTILLNKFHLRSTVLIPAIDPKGATDAVDLFSKPGRDFDLM